MLDPAPTAPDESLMAVRKWLINRAGGATKIHSFFERIIRRAIDEVIDGGRTGRWEISQLEKTEKTYIGTKVEILLRHELEAEKGERLDLLIEGSEVDVKMTIGDNWMIPTEALGQLCLLVKGNDEKGQFAVGLLRMVPGCVTSGGNKDGKVSVSAQGKKQIDWLVPEFQLKRNFLSSLTETERDKIMAHKRGQARVTELLKTISGRLIPRLAIETLGQQDDPMRRLRANGGAQESLAENGIVVLAGDWVLHREIAREKGLPVPVKGEVIGLKVTPEEAHQILERIHQK